MKKLMLIMLFILLMVGWMAAQSYTPSTDVLGAHNNGGRGCAGCHAPHSGGRGAGGDQVGTGSNAPNGTAEGDYHLWGQDMWAITSQTLKFGGGYTYAGGYTVAFTQGEWTASTPPYQALIASCLSCHDGNVSKGAMMMNASYEQQIGLPNGAGEYTTTGPLYGSATIPTLLGNDFGQAGDYLNDHPVGPLANVDVLSYPQPLANYGLTYTVNLNNPYTPISWTATGAYASFLTNYGAPGINGMQVDSTYQVPYVVCTTCHNQHQMNVYESPASGLGKMSGGAGGYRTYFYINAPYNPGASWTPTLAPSTTQFCRQCHFGEANEAFGNTGVGTAY